jgi:hypothetical protein
VYGRAVDEAASRLQALRHEERGDLALAVLSLGLAVAATQTWPALALPLLVGGLVMAALGIRAAWRRWDLVERLSGERDSYVIPEVRKLASQETTMQRRQTFAALIRSRLPANGTGDARLLAAADELEALAAELEDGSLALDPVAAVECKRLLSDVAESPLLNSGFAPEDLRARVRRIRSGFSQYRQVA